MSFRSIFVLALLLTADAARPNPDSVSDKVNSYLNPKVNAHRDIYTDNVNSTALTEAEANETEKMLGRCTNWCVQCPGDELSWKVVRARSTVKRFAMGAFAAGTLMALAATGGLFAIPLAGAFAAVGVASGTVMVAGGLAGTYLVRDMLTQEKVCTDVTFKQRNHDNAGASFKARFTSMFKSNDAWKQEQSYKLEEVNLLELMGQMTDDAGTNLLGSEYARNQIAPQTRLHYIMACNYLQFNSDKWGDLAVQDEHMTTMIRTYGDVKKAVLAECGKWLCAGKEGDMTITHLNSFMISDQCGGRRFR